MVEIVWIGWMNKRGKIRKVKQGRGRCNSTVELKNTGEPCSSLFLGWCFFCVRTRSSWWTRVDRVLLCFFYCSFCVRTRSSCRTRSDRVPFCFALFFLRGEHGRVEEHALTVFFSVFGLKHACFMPLFPNLLICPYSLRVCFHVPCFEWSIDVFSYEIRTLSEVWTKYCSCVWLFD